MIIMIFKQKAICFIVVDDQALVVVGLGLVLDVTSVLEALHAKVTHPRIGSQATSR